MFILLCEVLRDNFHIRQDRGVAYGHMEILGISLCLLRATQDRYKVSTW